MLEFNQLPNGWYIATPDIGKFAAACSDEHGHYLHKWRDSKEEAEKDIPMLMAEWNKKS